jgi:hypothetical protein
LSLLSLFSFLSLVFASFSLAFAGVLRADRGAADAMVVSASRRKIKAPRIDEGLTNRDAARNICDPTSYRGRRFLALVPRIRALKHLRYLSDDTKAQIETGEDRGPASRCRLYDVGRTPSVVTSRSCSVDVRVSSRCLLSAAA